VINISGILLGTKPIVVDKVDDFREFGTVYYSRHASSNILSFASQDNAGADLDYDKVLERFALTPEYNSITCIFGGKNIAGSEGKFYVRDLSEMMEYNRERAFVQTLSENLGKFSKREVEQPRAARDMLVRMGFPSASDAIDIVNSGSNLSLRARDSKCQK
jgi:hypothetical protein